LRIKNDRCVSAAGALGIRVDGRDRPFCPQHGVGERGIAAVERSIIEGRNEMVGLYVAAVLIPLFAFAVQAIFIRQLKRNNAYIATGAIGFSCLLSLIGFLDYTFESGGFPHQTAHAGAAEHGDESAAASHSEEQSGHASRLVWSGFVNWTVLGGGLTTTTSPTGVTTRGTDLVIPLGVSIDSLGVVMFVMVTFIATLIHIYSMEYMRDDPRYPLFFTYLSLFCFSMLGLVASSNVFMIFIFWELVGLCSYLLIGFWYEEKANCDAANKAFIVNRVGDVGMLVGLGLLWSALGTFDFKEINEGLRGPTGELNKITHRATNEVVELKDPVTHEVRIDSVTGRHREIPLWLLTIAGLGVFAGCVGKSAQFPLHVWLPDAMAGPTPVSALIHAATMVAAGVYLVGRFFPLFTSDVLLFIAYTGGITLFIAATIALVQTDYKKVLAYSTVSQLGFMMLGLGVGGWAAGLFHLVTHAFFKALLFLGAGSVYHGVHTYEMPALGGLLKKMPITAWTMLVGTLAISGVPFFSGFYSKDAILSAAMVRVAADPQHFLLLLLPAVGAVLTAFYMFRMWFLTFAGEPRGFASAAEAVHSHLHDDEHALDQAHGTGHGHGHGHDRNPAAHAHESGPLITWPLMILAFFSIFSGWTVWIGLPFGVPVLEHIIEYGEPYKAIDAHAAHYYALGASILIMLTGVGLGLLYYAPAGFPYFVPTRLSAARTAARLKGVYGFLVHKWYFDELYNAIFVKPCLELARLCRQIDQVLIDGFVNGSAGVMTLLSKWEGVFDMIAVDRLVNLTGRAVYVAGDLSRSIQTGRLRNYLMFLAVGLVCLFVGVFAWIQS
jgi:proton-translocating NADH-quinone oxidoreductase chain L